MYFFYIIFFYFVLREREISQSIVFYIQKSLATEAKSQTCWFVIFYFILFKIKLYWAMIQFSPLVGVVEFIYWFSIEMKPVAELFLKKAPMEKIL